jgi:hypothetical protein
MLVINDSSLKWFSFMHIVVWLAEFYDIFECGSKIKIKIKKNTKSEREVIVASLIMDCNSDPQKFFFLFFCLYFFYILVLQFIIFYGPLTLQLYGL